MARLDVLSEDILYLILEQLDTARDRAHLAQTCRALHEFMECHGWRSFTRTHFPSIFANRPRLVESCDFADGGWRDLASSLTWQSRAWDRRAISFQGLLPRNQHIPVRQRPRAFRPAIAAHFQADRLANGKRVGIGVDGEELLVWGAGEDVVARYRVRGRGTAKTRAEAAQREGGRPREDEPPIWEVLDGKAAGFQAGTDDVRAVTVVENAMGRPGYRGILTGRESGHLSLLAGEPDGTFGRVLTRLRPGKDDAREHGPFDKCPVNQSRLYSVDVAARSGLGGRFGRDGGVAAVTTPSHIVFYPMPQTEELSASSPGADDTAAVDIRPVATFSMGDYGLTTLETPTGSPTRLPFNARWTAADGVLAVGVNTGPDPLRYLTVTPSGEAVELTKAYRWSPGFASRFPTDEQTRLLPTALEPLAAPSSSSSFSSAGGGGQLMLSGWRDGTVRLQDLRTASPWDLVYQDNIMGASDLAQVLLYLPGTDRFVAGIQASAVLRTFDLRWPRHYFHTDALSPCSDRAPQPHPDIAVPGPDPDDLRRLRRPRQRRPRQRPLITPGRFWGRPPSRDRAAADDAAYAAASRRCCRWHTLSRLHTYRSTCSFYMAMSLAKHTADYDMGGVWALCHSGRSELAPASLYAGLSGCVVESVLSEYNAAWVPATAATAATTATTAAMTAPLSTVVEEAPGCTAHSYYGYRHPARRDDPHFGYAFGPSSGYPFGTDDNDTGFYRTVDVDMSMMETGDSLARKDVDTQASLLPSMRPRWKDPIPGTDSATDSGTSYRFSDRNSTVRLWEVNAAEEANRLRSQAPPPLAWQRQHRLDPSFQRIQDFDPWYDEY